MTRPGDTAKAAAKVARDFKKERMKVLLGQIGPKQRTLLNRLFPNLRGGNLDKALELLERTVRKNEQGRGAH